MSLREGMEVARLKYVAAQAALLALVDEFPDPRTYNDELFSSHVSALSMAHIEWSDARKAYRTEQRKKGLR